MCTVILPTVLEMAEWSKTIVQPVLAVKYSLGFMSLGGLNPNEYFTTRLYRRPHSGKGPGWIEPQSPGQTGNTYDLPINFLGWGNPYPIHLATLKTIMSHHGAGCIDEVIQIATTQSKLNGRGSTEKFNNDSNPAISSPIPIPSSESSVPPPRSTFKSIVIVLTVTFSMIVNVGCLFKFAVPVPPTHTFSRKPINHRRRIFQSLRKLYQRFKKHKPSGSYRLSL